MSEKVHVGQYFAVFRVIRSSWECHITRNHSRTWPYSLMSSMICQDPKKLTLEQLLCEKSSAEYAGVMNMNRWRAATQAALPVVKIKVSAKCQISFKFSTCFIAWFIDILKRIQRVMESGIQICEFMFISFRFVAFVWGACF